MYELESGIQAKNAHESLSGAVILIPHPILVLAICVPKPGIFIRFVINRLQVDIFPLPPPTVQFFGFIQKYHPNFLDFFLKPTQILFEDHG